MTSRAAILPFPGDPYLINYWLDLYDRVWGNEVDRLYIHLNSPIEQPMVNYIMARCSRSPRVKLIYTPQQIEHGDVINRTLDVVEEENIMLIEDDAFISKPGSVDMFFRMLEGNNSNYDIIGSKRGSCAMEILTRAKQLWGLDYEGEGDQGPNFWPSFFFTRKEILLKTDRNFGARAWKKGEVIPALGDYVVQDEIANGDTMVHMSLQLRAMIPKERILCIPQYHGHPDDMDHFVTHYAYSMFNGQATWCHIGSLSSGVGGILRDNVNRSLTRRLIDPPGQATSLPNEWCRSDFEKREFERRVQWWLTFYEHAKPTPDTKEFYDLYNEAIYRIIKQFSLRITEIRRRQIAYGTLGL